MATVMLVDKDDNKNQHNQ